MDNLPNIIIKYICHYLNEENIKSLSITSKKINNCTFKYKAVKYHFLVGNIEYDDNIGAMMRYYDHFKKLYIFNTFNMTTEYIIKIITKFRYIDTLAFEDEFNESIDLLSNQLPHLTSLSF